MEGLIEEAQELIGEDPESEVLDAGLISKAQHVEHYEIAGYGTVRAYAMLLGEEEHAALLQETLDEEGQTDKLLTELAETAINLQAVMAGDESENEQEEETASRSASSKGASKGGSKGAEREVSRNVGSDTRSRGGTSGRSGQPSGARRNESQTRQR
jgi:hypothetical protein